MRNINLFVLRIQKASVLFRGVVRDLRDGKKRADKGNTSIRERLPVSVYTSYDIIYRFIVSRSIVKSPGRGVRDTGWPDLCRDVRGT